ncbi:MAG: hypothetical protein ACJ788_14330 [Ktedonobacteraceae bacterium]
MMPAPTHPYNYIVYRTFDQVNGELFHAEHSDGTPLANTPQSTPDPVIQTALNQPFLGDIVKKGPGHAYIQTADPAVYNLSPAFTGFEVSSYTRITMDPTTILRVPSAYTGPVFHLRADDTVEVLHTIIDGGYIQQVGGSKQCVGILLENAATVVTSPQHHTPGVLFNKIMNTVIEGAAIGIQLSITGPGGWVNGNSFQSLKMYSCGVFIDFDDPNNVYPTPTPGNGAVGNLRIHYNHFDEVQCQCDAGVSVGVRNMRHIGNMFVDVKVWDVPEPPNVPAPVPIATIHQHATNTIILGGILTNPNAFFQDNGQFTKIFDQWQGLKLGNDFAIPAATRIGTSSFEPLAFFGKALLGQQPGSGSGETAGDSYGSTERDMLNALYSTLRAYGLI